MPVEKSGPERVRLPVRRRGFGDHIEKFDPDFSKVLVRYNPDGDAEMNERQLERLKRLADWLHENDRKFLFELLVPAEDAQLEQVGGDTDRYDAELRPELMRRAIEEIQDAGIEVDIWKIEGVDERSDARCSPSRPARARAARTWCACCSAAAPATRRSTTGCAQAAPVEGFVGLRDRPLDLVGRAEGLPRRLARARGRGRADRRELPALRQGLRGRRAARPARA